GRIRWAWWFLTRGRGTQLTTGRELLPEISEPEPPVLAPLEPGDTMALPPEDPGDGRDGNDGTPDATTPAAAVCGPGRERRRAGRDDAGGRVGRRRRRRLIYRVTADSAFTWPWP